MKKSMDDQPLVIFPAPPEVTRIQFLTAFSNSTDVTGGRSGFTSYVMGEEEATDIIKPYGISSGNGKIYICDTKLGGLEIIDYKNRTFEYFTPSGLGQFKKPLNCHVDNEGRLFVADGLRNQIIVFDENLKYLRAFGNTENSKITAVVTNDTHIYVADIGQHKIRVFSKDTYKETGTIPSADNTEEEAKLFTPINICLDSEHLYVSDFGSYKINTYNLEGQYIKQFGSYGRQIGQFVRPKGIAVDRDQNIYVVDAGFENVQIFNSEGNLLMFFGGSYQGPGYLYLPAQVHIDYENIGLFQEYVDDSLNLLYLIYVTNQAGPDKITVYGFVEPKNIND